MIPIMTMNLAELPSVIDCLTIREDAIRPPDCPVAMKRKSHHTDPDDDLRSSSQKRLKSPDGLDVKCRQFFRAYCDETGMKIGINGMEKLCHDLGVHPSNVVMLVLAWVMEAKEMCVFTLSEWMKGMGKLNCDSLRALRSRLPELENVLAQKDVFRQVYRFAFDFAKHTSQRSLEKSVACELLCVIFSHHLNSWCLLPIFLDFLKSSNYRIVTRDQWNNIFEFANTIDDDFRNYDEEGAWPVMLDEFVAERRSKLGLLTFKEGSSKTNESSISEEAMY